MVVVNHHNGRAAEIALGPLSGPLAGSRYIAICVKHGPAMLAYFMAAGLNQHGAAQRQICGAAHSAGLEDRKTASPAMTLTIEIAAPTSQSRRASRRAS